MSARLYLTVYADDDLPTEEAHIASKSLGTVTACTELSFTKHGHGTDALKLKINRRHPQAALLLADRYVIVHSDVGPVGGAFLEEAPIDLSAAEGPGDEWIQWSGRGSMAVLERGVMDNESGIGDDPIAGFWDLSNQGDFAGASNGHPIPMMKRVMNEIDTNAPNALAVVDHSSWDYDEDTDAVAPPFLGSIVYGANVGDDALQLAADMSQLGGVTWTMSHLFKMDAYISYGTDRTGAFGAAGKVRFEKGVNIADSLQRKIRGSVLRTHLIVGGADRTYITVSDPDYSAGDVVRWGFLSMPETADVATLTNAGLAHIAARKRQTDVWTFPQHDHGDSIASGIYEPAPPGTSGSHYWVGDIVTLHSGTGLYDANELAAPIGAITWQLKTGEEANGDYWVIPQVGATFDWPPPGPHHIPPAPPAPASPPAAEDDANAVSPGGATGLEVDVLDGEDLFLIVSGEWVADGDADAVTAAWYPNWQTVPVPGTAYPMTRIHRSSDSADRRVTFFGLIDAPAKTHSGRVIVQLGGQCFGAMISAVRATGVTSLTPVQTAVGSGTGTAGSAPVTADGLTISGLVIHSGGSSPPAVTPSGFDADWDDETNQVFTEMRHAGGWVVDGTGSWTWGVSYAWNAATVVMAGTPGSDAPSPPGEANPGTPGTYAPFTHVHPPSIVSPSSDPTVNDDSGDGHEVGLIWVNESTGTAFVLIDDTPGAAVWQEIGDAVSSVTNHGSMGAAETFDASAARGHKGTQDANLTVTLTGATSGEEAWMTLVLAQDGSGGHTLTLPASVVNGADIEAAWDLTAGNVNILTLFSYDGGANWYGSLLGAGGSSVGALDDLSDVTIIAAAEGDTLRRNATEFVNSNLHWEPMVDYDGLVMLDSAGGIHVHEVSH